MVLFFVACICNPIFINTFVVFVRLYWFEKRFQSVVLEAQRLRRSRSRSRSKLETPGAEDVEARGGVGDKKITIVHPCPETMEVAEQISQPSDSSDPARTSDSRDDRSKSSDNEKDSKRPQTPPLPFQRNITFADEIDSPTLQDPDSDRLPEPRSNDQHISFLQNQRHRKEKTLYIPGPRDFDKGYRPEEKDEDPSDELSGLSRARSADTFSPVRDKLPENQKFGNGHGRSASNTSNSKSVSDSTFIAQLKDRWPFTSRSTDDITESKKGTSTGDTSGGLRRRPTFASVLSRVKTEDKDPMPYLTWQPTVGRNSAFVNLTEEQREELGGIEYRALKTLATVLCCYFIGFQLFGMVSLLPWILNSGNYKTLLANDGSVNPAWWGVFTPASMFNDLGYTLTPDSMNSFNYAIWPLLVGSFLIIIGNTGFPCMLRFVIWVASKLVPRGSSVWEELQFLLDHPRRCFTLLFPGKATWWLFWVLVLLNGIDLLFFTVLDIHDSVVSTLPGHIKALDGWFQAASTRTAGFSVVNLAGLHPAVLVSYLIMMYISVFPIAISVRRTNVYEEKSLGVYGTEDENAQEQSYVGAHLRRQLSFDLWYVFLGFFIIAIVEGSRLSNTNDYSFTLFSVLFEVVSSYGTVGLSLGYPGIDASFSAEFHTLSKLVIIAMQIRGRHRGLPYALDKAILLPSDNKVQRENEEAAWRARRASVASQKEQHDGAAGDANAFTRRSSGGSGIAPDEQRRKESGLGRLLSMALGAGPARKNRLD